MSKKLFSPIIIRRETLDDIPEIHELNIEAFDGPDVADMVDLLRKNCDPFISIIAEINGQVVGYILFTPVQLVQNQREVLQGMRLAPLVVSPEIQGQGIGAILCKAGLEEMQTSGTPFVVVLGHSQYYPRFGFEPAANFDLRCNFAGGPEKAFMIKVFQPQKLEGLSGVVYCRQEFDAVS